MGGRRPAPSLNVVRVEVVRTGGFAGLRARGTLDTAAMEPEEAERVARLTRGLDALAQPESRGGRPDRFEYEITVEGGRRRIVAEEDLTPELRELVAVALRPPSDAGGGG